MKTLAILSLFCRLYILFIFLFNLFFYCILKASNHLEPTWKISIIFLIHVFSLFIFVFIIWRVLMIKKWKISYLYDIIFRKTSANSNVASRFVNNCASEIKSVERLASRFYRLHFNTKKIITQPSEIYLHFCNPIFL